MKVVAVSDQHLGYTNSDKPAFNQFLDHLKEDREVTDLVLLGDVVDMWRRDSSGVFLENGDTIEKVMGLSQRRVNVHYVAGNHDFHVLKLQNFSYPFNFVENLMLRDGDYTYRFLHGYEFDPLQKKPLMEALCRVMSDQAGNFESGLWTELTRDWSNPRYVLFEIFLFWKKGNVRRTADRLQQRPEDRLKGFLDQINSRACANVKPREILIFGHTHSPFVNKSENVVNSGSWVKDATNYDTYVELTKGKPRLFVFGGHEITQRIEC